MSGGDTVSSSSSSQQRPFPVTLSRMKQYVGDRIRSVNNYMGNYVDERLRRVSTKLNGHVMESADTIAEKIGDIAESTSGDCAYDRTSPPNNLYVSKRRVNTISEIRRRRPETFELLAALAQEYLDMQDDEDKTKKSTWLLMRVAELTGSSSSVLRSRMISAKQRRGEASENDQ